MSEDNTELENIPPFKEVALGEWFQPFQNYYEIPYDVERQAYRLKTLHLLVLELGRFSIGFDWDRESKWVAGTKGITVLPFGEEKVDLENFEKIEMKLESRLFAMMVFCDEEKSVGRNFPYKVEMILPSGQKLVSFFGEKGKVEESDEPVAQDWSTNGEQDLVLLIPEVEQVLEKIQMRIVPIEQNSQIHTPDV